MANPLAPRYGAIDGHLAAVAAIDTLSFAQTGNTGDL